MKTLVDFVILLTLYVVPFVAILTLFYFVEQMILKHRNKTGIDRYPTIKTVRRKYE